LKKDLIKKGKGNTLFRLLDPMSTEMVEFLIEDSRMKVIAVYLEGIDHTAFVDEGRGSGGNT
jgi:hypothetical protein